MGRSERKQLVFTVKDKCRVCYTCLRECPAKAIRIINGQAEVIHERCIGCGNCVKVCSQDAKVYLKTTTEAASLLLADEPVVACLAPSFAAEFTDIPDHRLLVGMIRALGFSHVVEVAFGADMIAREYHKLMKDNERRATITSDCPAIVYFIEHYHPDLVPCLAPIASPMVATVRIVHKKYGANCKTIFIGPCIAKKAESDEVDEVLTFRELRELFQLNGISPDQVEAADFDPPYAGKGAIFPISGGLLQSSEISSSLYEGGVLLAEGRVNIRDAVKEFEEGLVQARHLELLCCEGCIMGAGMSPQGKKYARRNALNRYVSAKLEQADEQQTEKQQAEFSAMDFSQSFDALDRRINDPSNEEITRVLHSMGKFTATDMLNCCACGYDTCVEHAIAVVQGLAENEMCLPWSIEKLHNYIKELNISNEKLASAKQALQQSERLASLGQLSAGIAHELNNPLGVITMYSNILMDESKEDDPMREDLNLIVEQADRCKKIVSGLLNFARKNKVNVHETKLDVLLEHSLNSVIIPADVQLSVRIDPAYPLASLDYDQMTQVMVNLLKNAIDAMPEGGKLSLDIGGDESLLVMIISDTGCGISREDMTKVFTPFFTTKGIGKGTGLGLPIIYGIVKMHKGNITVESNADPQQGPTGTRFTLSIPRNTDHTINNLNQAQA
ncbi:MAG TPA: [Fe-Fe] hydrogenase large subunit C-terminal domain-containing protein [Bacteroidales bacterium]|nr:[Fe-Fe] hydrogenase large subunit C-terminal domain-containing protein [Bacteroidales bacterium]HSA42496.1 [Fe-Fe] hydrogenase large subunit C-terminal domain-containing protein [Bacteroidales bacterium]